MPAPTMAIDGDPRGWRSGANRLLHLADGDAGIPRRDGRMAGFPDGFGWIHAHDALAAAEGAKTG
ncbi:MAG: hypothetical protein IOC86_14860 [Aestuariivirga sp.]|nr:hypothetical protein [Aestuariivirga sp.]